MRKGHSNTLFLLQNLQQQALSKEKRVLFEYCVFITVSMSELTNSSPPVASPGSHDRAKVVFSVHTCNFTPRILLSPAAAQYARPATSAANRSIGSTTGFHNHGEGPY